MGGDCVFKQTLEKFGLLSCMEGKDPEAVKVNSGFVKKLEATRLPDTEEERPGTQFIIDQIKKPGPHACQEGGKDMIDVFKEDIEQLIGYVDTDSGGLLITDMIWDMPKTSPKRTCLDLKLGQVRIPVKTVIKDGKRRLIIEIDEALDRTEDQDVVEVEEKE